MNHNIELKTGDTLSINVVDTKLEHYDGEPCNADFLNIESKEKGVNFRFEHTGIYTEPNDANTWSLTTEDVWGGEDAGKIAYGAWGGNHWILRAIPVKQEFKSGDIVAVNNDWVNDLIVAIDSASFHEGWWLCASKNGEYYCLSKSFMRHATEYEVNEFYTVVGKGGERARFYYTVSGDIEMWYNNSHSSRYDNSYLQLYTERKGYGEVAADIQRKAVLGYFGLDGREFLIMPYKQSKGNYKPPQNKKENI